MSASNVTQRLLVVLALGLAGAAGWSDEPESAMVVNEHEVTATVTALDRESRQITLRSAEGDVLTFVAGQEVRNLNQVEVGDRVSIGFYTGIAAQIVQADQEPVADLGIVSARAAPGERPARVESTMISAVVTIQSIDADGNRVTFRDHDDIMRTVTIERPEMLQFVRDLRAGDKVRITYTEAIAVRVDPAS
ncbi:MAG: hypothetical protein KF911_01725 [Pseudomonadales bacterium]|nr:hypothetical protein [Pseudomonadales bacterium]